ncbi:MAG: lipid A deacylase LpxR family protein [Cytophagales bacterium]
MSKSNIPSCTLFLLFWVSTPIFSQKIEHLASIRSMNSHSYGRIHYENDWFSGFDQYYTQGINLECVNPVLKSNPINVVLLKLPKSTLKYGLAFDHNGYTPTSIRSDGILYGDRPFAATFVVKSFSISIDTVSRSSISAGLSVGIIGSAAIGKQMQSTIHGWIGGTQPQGWQHQIQNDLAVNYEINHEKLLINTNFFSLNSNAQIKIGSLSDKLQAGFTFTLGKFNSVLAGNAMKNQFQMYIYSQPLVNFVGYDATMQGGLFNSNRPYTLKADEIERIVFQNNFGAILKFKKLYLEYHQTIITKEFSQGLYHRWGGIKIGFIL